MFERSGKRENEMQQMVSERDSILDADNIIKRIKQINRRKKVRGWNCNEH